MMENDKPKEIDPMPGDDVDKQGVRARGEHSPADKRPQRRIRATARTVARPRAGAAGQAHDQERIFGEGNGHHD